MGLAPHTHSDVIGLLSDMSANDTGREWQCNLSNATVANVNALSELRIDS